MASTFAVACGMRQSVPCRCQPGRSTTAMRLLRRAGSRNGQIEYLQIAATAREVRRQVCARVCAAVRRLAINEVLRRLKEKSNYGEKFLCKKPNVTQLTELIICTQCNQRGDGNANKWQLSEKLPAR